MSRIRPKLLYVAAMLPKRSETFVYRELLGLRADGWDVDVLSIRPPELELGSEELDALAQEAMIVYRGLVAMARGVARELVDRPAQSLRTLATAARLACSRDDISGLRRLKLGWQALGVLGTAAAVRARGIEHVHAHMAHVPTSIAMLLAEQLDVPFSFTGHAVDIFSQRTLLRTKLQRATFCACISLWHRDFYQDLLEDAALQPLEQHRLPVVRCGVDIKEFSPPKSRAPGPLRIVTVGRLIEKKGFDLLLHALAQLSADMPEFSCTIVGGGEQAETLAKLCRELALEGCVMFTGPLPNHEVQAKLQTADMFVLPCRVAKSGDRDGIPVVLMEAMASGVPVVAGDIPSIRELVQHNHSGLLVAPESVSELRRALERLIAEPPLRDSLARAGRERVVEEFALARNVGRIAQSILRVHGAHLSAVGESA